MAVPKRVSQRIPLTCQNCSKQKVRCDKSLPCSRCQTKGLDCRRQLVVQRDRNKKSGMRLDSTSESHGSVSADLSFPMTHHNDGRPRAKPGSSSFQGLFSGNVDLDSEPNALSQTSRADREHAELVMPNLHDRPPVIERMVHEDTQARNVSVSPYADSANEQRGFSGDIATSVEGLAWGTRLRQHHPRADHSKPETLCHINVGNLPARVARNLPTTTCARALVRLHVDHLRWDHNVIHAPTFLEQCDTFFDSGQVEDSQWLALYLAILSASAWSLENANCTNLEESMSMHRSSNEYFDSMVEALHHFHFMERHTIFAVQAIIIAGMVAHVIGKSNLFQTMLHSCVYIAQSLGLHQITEQKKIAIDDLEQWQDSVNREVAKRVWWKLVQLDYFSVACTNTYSINPKHFTTVMPSNCEDHDLEVVDAADVTTSTYTIIMSEIALLLPDLLDGLCAPNSPLAQYEHVIAVDARMRAIVRSIPSGILRSRRAGQDTPWLELARRTLAIAAADKILMIHRPFLIRSFRSPVYLFTKNTCIAAATTILREHENILNAGSKYYPMWIHSAFCVTAVVVLCLHMIHGALSQEMRQRHESLVASARARLSAQRSDTMARRGVHLIDAMLGERYGEHGVSHTDRIFERFWYLEQSSSISERQANVEVPIHSDFYARPDDFEAWFNDLFDLGTAT